MAIIPKVRRRPQFVTSFILTEFDLAETMLQMAIDRILSGEGSIEAERRAACAFTPMERLPSEHGDAICQSDLDGIQERHTLLRATLDTL